VGNEDQCGSLYRCTFYLRRIVHKEGLYSGVFPSLVGISHVAVQFPSNEQINSNMEKKGNSVKDLRARAGEDLRGQICKVVDCIRKHSGRKVLHPKRKKSEVGPRPDGHVNKSRPNKRASAEESKISQTHSNKITP
ncbi:hypothetical protein Goari_022583, partial [Gossypium aridum]|nr:hypothetical protein [Gossypium aridum]